MARNIDEIIKRLLELSRQVIKEFGVLAALSYHDHEDSFEFDVHIKKTNKLLDTEAIIINNLAASELFKVFKLLVQYDDDTLTYERTMINIEARIEQLQGEEMDIEFDEEEISKVPDDNDIQSYFIEDFENEKYDGAFANYINIFALKRMEDRINSAIATCDTDIKYKNKLLRHLKVFKYLVFSQNPVMERYGLKYRFNVAKMPYMEALDIDAGIIAYNHCIAIIEKMYNPPETNDKVSDTAIELFNMICFENYLEHIDIEYLHKLASLCDHLSEKAKNRFYGDIAKHKILSKNKN